MARPVLVNKPVNLAGLKLANRLMNGAYIHSKSLKDVQKIVNSACGAVVVGSISVKPRQKNTGSNYWRHKENIFALNSYGMPNGGLQYFSKTLSKMVTLAHKEGKPLIANLIGFSNAEFVELIKFAEKSGADMAELNFGCPNVWENGHQEKIISYHPLLVKNTLLSIKHHSPKIKLAVKISPLPPDILRGIADAIVASGIVQVVTATNSYPNAAVTSGAQNGRSSIKLAGLTGRALKPLSLGVVQQLRALLPKTIQIIGAGGISTLTDVKDYLKAGASAVQIATALKEEGLPVFEKILKAE